MKQIHKLVTMEGLGNLRSQFFFLRNLLYVINITKRNIPNEINLNFVRPAAQNNVLIHIF